jgi:protein phosphatase
LDWLRNLFGGSARGLEPGPPPRQADPAATVDLPGGLESAALGGPSRLVVGVISAVGNYREHNEDNFYVPGRPSLPEGPERPSNRGNLDTTSDSEVIPDLNAAVTTGAGYGPIVMGPSGLFVVADGMGGQLAGEKASQMAVELIPREVNTRLDSSADERKTQDVIRDAVVAANREILALSHLDTERHQMGTTVVLLQFRREKVYVANLGDSRAYRLRGGRLEQLTKDHSLATALKDAGTITAEEEERHKFKNVLYLYLGCNDARDGPDVRVIDVKPGDRFLLCTDGLTGVVKDDQLVTTLGQGDDPQRTAERLIDAALANLSKDNVTSVVIHAL